MNDALLAIARLEWRLRQLEDQDDLDRTQSHAQIDNAKSDEERQALFDALKERLGERDEERRELKEQLRLTRAKYIAND